MIQVYKLKDIINTAAKIREESWVEGTPLRQGEEDALISAMGFYSASLIDASKKACADADEDPELAWMIFLLLQDSIWNESLAWANTQE